MSNTYNKGSSIHKINSKLDFESLNLDLQNLLNYILDSNNSSNDFKIAANALNFHLDPNHNYFFKPHVLEEISKINSKINLITYLSHRFRYDQNPVSKSLDDYPPCLQIELTSICNLRCIFCFQTDSLLTKKENGHMGQMDLDLFKKIIDEIENKIHFITFASRGEPLLSKNFIECLDYTKNKFLGLKINTNATFLTEEKIHAILRNNVNTLVFSAESYDSKSYEKTRIRGDFDKIVSNIKQFNSIKKQFYPESKIITRVSGVNYSPEIQDYSKMWDFWNSLVDQVVFVDYNPWENCYIKPENGISESCSDLWRRTFIWWDGKVNPCDVDYRSMLSVGNVNETSLSSIWTNNAYKHLRDTHLKARRNELMPCKGCIST